MSKWDFIKNIAEKAGTSVKDTSKKAYNRVKADVALRMPNGSDRFRRVMEEYGDKLTLDKLNGAKESDLNKLYAKLLVKDSVNGTKNFVKNNKLGILAGLGAGYGLGSSDEEEEPDEELTGFENIDDISPKLLKTLIDNGYIHDPDNELLGEEKSEDDENGPDFEAYGEDQADIIKLLQDNGFNIKDDGKYYGSDVDKIMKLLIKNGYYKDYENIYDDEKE